MAKKTVISVVYLLVYLAMLLNGCSLIGHHYGSKIDARGIPVWQVETVKIHSKVRVKKKNGEEFAGEYMELRQFFDSEYAQRYQQSKKQIRKNIYLPDLGETITIVDKLSGDMKLRFLGFGWRGPGREYLIVEGQENNDQEIVSLRWATSIIGEQGDVLDVNALRALFSGDGVASSAVIVIHQKSKVIQIPLNEIAEIQWYPTRAYTIVGTALGFLVDAGVAVGLGFLIYYSNNPPCSGF